VKKGTISLGVRDRLYEAMWTYDRRKITFYFTEDLPYPHQLVRELSFPVEKWHPMLPYQIGGELVNEMMEEQ
jgi:hypothetical protein